MESLCIIADGSTVVGKCAFLSILLRLIPAICSCLIIISPHMGEECFQFDSTKHRRFSPAVTMG
jgi:hypothetical protein